VLSMEALKVLQQKDRAVTIEGARPPGGGSTIERRRFSRTWGSARSSYTSESLGRTNVLSSGPLSRDQRPRMRTLECVAKRKRDVGWAPTRIMVAVDAIRNSWMSNEHSADLVPRMGQR
jgi:hypothetical protein